MFNVMSSLAHSVLVVAFLALPAVALVVSILFAALGVPRRRWMMLGVARLLTTGTVGILIASATTMIYLTADGSGATISTKQTLVAAYFATSLILLVGLLDGLVVRILDGVSRWLRGPRESQRHSTAIDGSSPPNAEPPPTRNSLTLRRVIAIAIPTLLRPAIMMAIALPYVMLSVLTYRPKLTRIDDPESRFNIAFETVRFETSDHLNLAGWWIPARAGSPRQSAARRRHESATILICHGIGSGKADALRFAGPFHRAGYNVMLFDFRAHGASDGQITSLGGLEQRDVLAAIQWIETNHADHAKRLLGFGMSTGAAALIEAAVDSSAAGQSIDALAVYESFDSLDALGDDLLGRRMSRPLGRFMTHVGLSLGTAQVGTSLHDVAPAKIVNQLWPRPIEVIHAVDDPAIPFDRGRSLFDAADEPKRAVWLPMTLPNQRAVDAAAIDAALDFFEEARPVPAV